MDVHTGKVQTAGVSSPWDERRNNFDALRLVLALLVLYSHAFPLATGSERFEPLARITHGQVTGGAIAVDSFFVMSGFLITGSALRSATIAAFLRKRVQRIYPAFAAAALLSFFLFLPLSGGTSAFGSAPACLQDVLLQTLRLREFHYRSAFAHNPYPGVLNGSLWSIAYEFWCYLGVAGLLAGKVLVKRSWMCGLFGVAWIVSILFRLKGWVLGGMVLGLVLGPPQIWARLLPLYLSGVTFYLLRASIPRKGHLALASICALAIASFLKVGWTALFPLAGSYLLLFAAYSPQLRLSRVGRFGDFSYGLYLYAFPVEQLVMLHLGHPVSPERLFLLATPPTVLLAVLSWYGVERLFLRPDRRHEAAEVPQLTSPVLSSSALS